MKHTLKAALGIGTKWCNDIDELLAIHIGRNAEFERFEAQCNDLPLTETEAVLLKRLRTAQSEAAVYMAAIKTSKKIIGDLLIAFEVVAKARGLLN